MTIQELFEIGERHGCDVRISTLDKCGELKLQIRKNGYVLSQSFSRKQLELAQIDVVASALCRMVDEIGGGMAYGKRD